MALRILQPGHFTTVQDRGRPGFREWGVPPAGAFDRTSFDLANALLGNSEGCAALELTYFGGLYESLAPLALALAGAPMETAIVARDGAERPVAIPGSFTLEAGDRLRIGGTPVGVRSYLAVRGGFQTATTLGSRSQETCLIARQVVAAESGTTSVRHPAESCWSDPLAAPIRLIEGPDAAWGVNLHAWLGATFHVGRDANRMGLRMEGPRLEVRAPAEPLSRPTAPGAVQAAGGQMIILGVACGTMGGYAHVAHVIAADLDRIAQLRPGDIVTFCPVSLEDARRVERAQRLFTAERNLRLATMAQSGSDGGGRVD